MSRITKDKKDRYEKVAIRFWENVGIILKEKHITWKEIAEKMNTDPRALAARKANHRNSSFGNVMDIACNLNFSVDYLLYIDNYPLE